MAPVVTMKQLLEAGVHFGHQTRRWNPKMKRFIYGERNGIYIIDLQQTLQRIEAAYTFVRDLVADGGSVLFIGTKKQAQDPIATSAAGCGMPYVNERWLGGMLTNFTTISGRVKKMQEYQRMRTVGDFGVMPKKEALMVGRELEKLERNLGGIQQMTKLPEAVFVIDTKKEHIGVTEANKLRIPVVAVVDTNCDPDIVDYVIPGNDDAIRSGALMCRVISDAVKEGRFIAERRGTSRPAPAVPTPEQEAERARSQADARAAAARQAADREARVAATTKAVATPEPAAGSEAEPIGEASDRQSGARQAQPGETTVPDETAGSSPAAGSEEESDLAVPSQSAPVVAHERAGEPEPEATPEPSDAEEPNVGAIPAADADEAPNVAGVEQALPGSATAEEPPHLEEATTGENG